MIGKLQKSSAAVTHIRMVVRVLLIFWITPLVALGQLSTASLTGVISDPSGAVIPGVQVTAMNVETNTGTQSVTDVHGRYTFLNLQTGRYTVTARFKGFKTTIRLNVALTVNQSANLNFRMQPGAVTQVVNVSAQAPLLNATNATIGTQLTTKDFEDLPINGRNYTQLLALTPGSTSNDVSQSAGRLLAPGGSDNPTLQGDRNRSNFYMIDGSPNVELSFNGLALIPPLDSIQEVNVESDATDTQFGGASGGFVNLTTKAGTSQFHGSAYEYLQNNALDSRNPFLPNVNVAPYHQNQFGFTLGGPVILPWVYHPNVKKTWFFASYEGFRNHREGTTLTRVPTAAEREGDFSGAWITGGKAINAIYDPSTTVPDPKRPGQFLRTRFPGNVIPSQDINPAAAAFLKEFMPLPNFVDPNLARSDNFEENLHALYDTDSGVVRIDQNLGDRNHFTGHFLYFTALNGGPSISVKPMSTTTQNPNDNITVQWDRNQTPTLFFDVQYAYMHSNYPVISTTAGDYVNAYNIDNPNAFPIPTGAPPLLPNFGFTFYAAPFGQSDTQSNTVNQQVTVNAQKIWGSHTMKFGFNAFHSHAFEGNISQDISFGLTPTQNLENPANSGDGVASFLLGLPTGADRLLGAGLITLNGDTYGAYLQDTFRVNKRLTLDYGLRYDYRGDLTSATTLGSFDMQTGGWLLDGPVNIPNAVFQGPNARKGIVNPAYRLFAPHVALAYALRPKTVIRSGFGIFYDLYSAWVQDAQGVRVTWPTSQFQTTPLLNSTSPNVTLSNPFLGLPNSVYNPDPEPASGYQLNPNMATPYVEEWNASAEHAFTDNTLMTITYAGSRGVHLDCCGLYNMAESPQVGVPESKILHSSHVPWPQMLVFRTDMGNGWSSYNAFEIGVQKRFGRGLTALANYTWSHSLDDACSGSLGAEGCFITQPYNPGANYSDSAYDLPNVLNIAFDYQLPIGPGQALSLRNSILNHVFGGWQLSAVMRRESGAPLSVGQGLVSDRANVGGSVNQTPNLTCSPDLPNRSDAEWFNTSCFALPPQYTYGTAGRNILRGPAGPGSYNFSFMKNFKLYERLSLQYRADFFNTFNLAYPSNPDTTFGDPNFGQILGGSGGRTIQMALRVTF
ncbi:MAG: carboxypeptidase regulatory-like domain-containing protein [Terriglobia bacterium]